MSKTEFIEQIDKMSFEEQQELFVYLTKKVVGQSARDSKRWLGKKLSFDEACEVVFRENRELLSQLAK
jgi:hypothetical protein